MKTFIIFPILGLIPFYLGLPWVNKKVDEYLMGNAYYGEKQFKTDIQTPTYYKAVGTSLLVVLWNRDQCRFACLHHEPRD